MDINLKYRNVFDDLYKSPNGLLAYTLYSRYELQPNEAINLIDKYEKAHYISIDKDQRIRLTNDGYKDFNDIIKSFMINCQEVDGYMSLILSPEKIDVFEPYLPKVIHTKETKEGEIKKLVSRSEVAPIR